MATFWLDGVARATGTVKVERALTKVERDAGVVARIPVDGKREIWLTAAEAIALAAELTAAAE